MVIGSVCRCVADAILTNFTVHFICRYRWRETIGECNRDCVQWSGRWWRRLSGLVLVFNVDFKLDLWAITLLKKKSNFKLETGCVFISYMLPQESHASHGDLSLTFHRCVTFVQLIRQVARPLQRPNQINWTSSMRSTAWHSITSIIVFASSVKS